MSAEDTKSFFAKLLEDTELQEKARAVSGSREEQVAALVALAATCGFAVTPEDLAALRDARAGAALDDEDISHVAAAGLACPGADVVGVENPHLVNILG